MSWDREPEDEFERWMYRMMRRFWDRYPKPFAIDFSPFGSLRFGPPSPTVRSIYADIQETDNDITIIAEIPGVRKEDININATEDRVEISAEIGIEKEETEKEMEYIRKERRYKKFYRSFKLPVEVIPDKAKATYKNGILELRLPKKEGREKRSIKIE
ncbi:MAG: Hsp20/alpha crystallin family protein [Candidatus Jordarchaeum sp.]|uniref:Hsp20/alpha crystallin family protein n=1 Tax=Candidatus Jordarchaeum sp. TaxID=2823881 RepID=UPI00404B12EB